MLFTLSVYVSLFGLDCILVHGAAYLLRERHFLVSDFFVSHICSRCGFQAQANLREQFFFCANCSSDETVVRTPVSYAFKLLYQRSAAETPASIITSCLLKTNSLPPISAPP
jgi:hypothetical protein